MSIIRLLSASLCFLASPLAGAATFLGLSDATTTANSGLQPMYQACRDTYTATARMCSSSDVIESGEFALVTSDAWVFPSPIAASTTRRLGGTEEDLLIVDASGQVFKLQNTGDGGGYACGGWGGDSGAGALGAAVVLPGGQFGWRQCTNTLKVACCD